MQKGALPGFRDFYPEDLSLRSHIFETWRRVATRYGFEEYDGPPLESLELYTAKSGDEIVGQLYNFVDKGDRPVALRPEMTPTLARMVAARANGLKKPIRWFSLPQLFRYERQQRGRLREHFQLNCDLIGEAGPLADAEIVALAIDLMQGFELTAGDVQVRISDRELVADWLREVGVPDAALSTAFQAIDRLDKNADQTRAILEGIRPGIASTIISSLTEGPARDELRWKLTARSGEVSRYGAVADALDQMGLSDWLVFDPTVVRGLAYYTGTVFEMFDRGKTLRAICGGGRYDNLTGAVGGVDLPAVGFGMGDVVLGELLKEKGKLPSYAGSIDAFVSGEEMPAVLRLTHELRDAGIRTEFALGGQTLSKQQDIAKARNARLLVTIGAGDAQVKDLVTKAPPQSVPLVNAVESIKTLLSAGR